MWGTPLSDRVPLGMMTIVYDISPDQFDLEKIALRRGLDATAIAYLTSFQKDLEEEHATLAGDAQFSVIFEYKLALVKREGQADISLVVGPEGEKLVPLHIPKDAATTHPYRQKELLQEVARRTDDAFCPTSGDLVAVKYAYDIEKKQEFFYQSMIKNSHKQYSDKFVDWLISCHGRDEKFLPMARAKYKAEVLDKNKKRKGRKS